MIAVASDVPEMVKRVAQAICPLGREVRGNGCFNGCIYRLSGRGVLCPYDFVAIRAIEAMREPTEGMYSAGKRQIGLGHDPMRNYSDHVWRAMCDAALGRSSA